MTDSRRIDAALGTISDRTFRVNPHAIIEFSRVCALWRIRSGALGMSQHATEVAAGERFEFGKNWARFLQTLNDDKIEEAIKSLQDNLETESLAGKSFLDIGSGSGLFSLAARRLGARVHSFDYDPNSVACTAELKRRYFPDDDCLDRGDGLGARQSLSAIARTIRCRLFLGRAAPHRRHVDRTGQCCSSGGAGRKVVHRYLQRSGNRQPPLDEGEKALQPPARWDQVPGRVAFLLGAELALAGERQPAGEAFQEVPGLWQKNQRACRSGRT